MLSGRAICRQIRPRILVSKRTFTHIPRLVQRNAVEVLSISSKLNRLGSNTTRLPSSIFQTSIPRRFYASELPSHIKIMMPALSPTMTQGNIGQWAKKVGDKVSVGDVLVSIETDKATMDFEAQEEGYLAKILVDSGAKDVEINKLIAIIAENKEDIDKFANFSAEESAPAKKTEPEPEKPKEQPKEQPKEEPKEQQQPSKEQRTSSDSRIFISPAAKKLASEKGISISAITGTGPSGRIVLSDVEKYISSGQSEKKQAPAQTTQQPPKAPQPSGDYIDIPLTQMRKVIASRLTQSKQSVPHYYMTVDINVDKLLKVREEFNAELKDAKLSINDFIIKGCSLSLLKVPEVNSSFQGDFIRQYNTTDISVAVATPTGLITPIVFNAQSKGLVEISKNVRELAAKAKEGKLQPNEFQGGTFTISNLGMYSVDSFTAIINPPQSAILAIGSANKVLVPSNSEKGYSTSSILKVTMSSDHRVIDGAVAATFLHHFKSLMQNPINMLL